MSDPHWVYRPLLDLIGHAEGTDKGDGYNETLGYGAYSGGDVNLVGMTLSEVDVLQTRMLDHPDNRWNSSAAGRYQIVRKTLRGLRSRLGLTGRELYDADRQDRLARVLLFDRGIDDYCEGRIGEDKILLELAREWASFPKADGEGYYSGQGGKLKPTQVRKALHEVRSRYNTNAPPFIPISISGEPTWMVEARKLDGLKEIVGSEHEPRIIEFAAEVGHSWVKDDETAWCASFVGSMLKRAGIAGTGKLNARSYLTWGKKLSEPIPGCIVVFSRGDPKGWQGHVAFFVKEEGGKIHVLGGNQANAVSVAPYGKDRLLGYRWPAGVDATAVETEPVKPASGNVAAVAGASAAGAGAAGVLATSGHTWLAILALVLVALGAVGFILWRKKR